MDGFPGQTIAQQGCSGLPLTRDIPALRGRMPERGEDRGEERGARGEESTMGPGERSHAAVLAAQRRAGPLRFNEASVVECAGWWLLSTVTYRR